MDFIKPQRLTPAIQLLALLAVAPPTQPAKADLRLYYMEWARTLPLKGTADCRSPKTTLIESIGPVDHALHVCVDHTRFLHTATGGRVPVILAWSMERGPSYDSYISEVNCQTLESRSKDLWSFTAADKSKDDLGRKWRRVGELWVEPAVHGRWTRWEPIEEVSPQQQWICDNR